MAARLETMTAERQKNEEGRRELIAGISHDLRTPLASIKMSVDGIKSGAAATAEQRGQYLAIIENQTCAMEHIINQLFLFSKLDMADFPAEMRIVNCGDMLKTMTPSRTLSVIFWKSRALKRRGKRTGEDMYGELATVKEHSNRI
jgi:signal transduction histidine kinase